MTRISAGATSTSPPARSGSGALATIARLAVGAKKAEDKKDDEKSEDKKDDEKSEDKKDDKDADKGDGDDEKSEDDSDEEKSEDDSDEEDAQNDNDDGDDEQKSEKAARFAERSRIRKILTSKHASLSEQHYANAAYIAFETNMTAKEAIGMLMCMPVVEQTASRQKDSLRERMQTQPNPKVQSDAGGGSGPNLADQIILAGKKRRGEKI